MAAIQRAYSSRSGAGLAWLSRDSSQDMPTPAPARVRAGAGIGREVRGGGAGQDVLGAGGVGDPVLDVGVHPGRQGVAAVAPTVIVTL
jgi:hypothetical protein